MLENTKSQITLSDNISTPWFDVTCGVRQGDPLSPTLFSLFINDLVEQLKTKCSTVAAETSRFNSLLYADDMVLIAESEDKLQEILSELNSWCYQWRIKINEEKSKVVHFRKGKAKQTEYEFKLNKVIIEKKSSYKYLGIWFDENMKFDLCIKTLADSAGRALGATINKFKSLKNVGFSTFTKLYNCTVTPILEYGSSVWGYKKAPEIDLIQNRAMRFFLGVHKYTPTDGMLGDMGWCKPYVHRNLGIVRFWNRMIEMENNRLTKRIFNTDHSSCHDNWSSNTLKLMNDINSSGSFHLKQTLNLMYVENTLIEHFKTKWNRDIAIKPKLRTCYI